MAGPAPSQPKPAAEANKPGAKAGAAAGAVSNVLTEPDYNLGGLGLAATPAEVKRVLGPPDEVKDMQNEIGETLWIYRDQGVTWQLGLSPGDDHLLSIAVEGDGQGRRLPKPVTPRGVGLGDSAETLAAKYGPWEDAGDGFLYVNADRSIGLKFRVENGRVRGIALFLSD